MHDGASQAAQRSRGLGGVGVVGVGTRPHGRETVGGLAQRQDARVRRDADEGIGRGGASRDDRCGQRAVRVAVGHAGSGCVDEVAAGFGRYPWGAVHAGVDDRDRDAGAGGEFLGVGQSQVVVGPRLVGEVRVRKHRRSRTDPALLHGLVRAGLVGRHRPRVDDGRFDCTRGWSQQQHQRQRGNQRTYSAHAASPPDSPDRRPLLWCATSKLATQLRVAVKLESRVRGVDTRKVYGCRAGGRSAFCAGAGLPGDRPVGGGAVRSPTSGSAQRQGSSHREWRR